MNNRITKAIAASLMAAAMIAPTAAKVAPMAVSAGQVLGETSFDYKAIPWHTVENSPAKQNFLIEDGTFHITIMKPLGGDELNSDLRFRHRNLNFKAGHTYKVSFQAKASRSGMELCSKIGNIAGDEDYFVLNGITGTMEIGPYMGGQWGSVCELSNEWQTFSGTFTPTSDIEGAEWTFCYAKDNAGYGGNAQSGDEIYFDNMSIECTTCPDDYAEGTCNVNPDTTYGAVNRDNASRVNGLVNANGEITNYISVNQLGYYPNLAKIAVLGDNTGDVFAYASEISLENDTYTFELVDAESDDVVHTGTTGKKTYDADSDDNICKIDFTEYDVPGRYYLRIKGQDWRSVEFDISDSIYEDNSHNMLTNALNYFYQNRSGVDILSEYISSGNEEELAHDGGHKTDTASVQKVWRNDYYSTEEAEETYASSTITASGGWYDAADHGKYVVSGGISVWTLQNMYERAVLIGADKEKFADNSGVCIVPEAGNEIPDVLDEAAFELDWMAKMKVDENEPAWGEKAGGLYYHKLQDHKWTGLAVRPYDYEEEWGTTRIVKPPTFAATLNYAACAAQAARLWYDYDKTKSETYLESAVEAYEAYWKHYYEYDGTSTTHPDLYCECPKEELREDSLYAPMWQAKGGSPYGDDKVDDDAYWAACEIFVSASRLGETEIAEKFKKEIDDSKYAYLVYARPITGMSIDLSFTSFNWQYINSLGSLTLALNKDLLSAEEAERIEKNIVSAANEYIKVEEKQGYGLPYLYDGPGFNDPNNLDPSIVIGGYEYGSNSMVINNCIVMAYAYDLTGEMEYINGVASAMDYLLGCNPLSFSYITGYGSYGVQNPSHKYWANEVDKYFPKAPDGVLSGGPNAGVQDEYIRLFGFVPGWVYNSSQRCYIDSVEAWSVNEVAPHWNAPLAWVVSFMQDEAPVATAPPEPTTPGGTDGIVWGDANDDGKVLVNDAVLIMAYVTNPESVNISDKGLIGSDVYQYGDGVSITDAASVQKYLIKSLKTLPESYM